MGQTTQKARSKFTVITIIVILTVINPHNTNSSIQLIRASRRPQPTQLTRKDLSRVTTAPMTPARTTRAPDRTRTASPATRIVQVRCLRSTGEKEAYLLPHVWCTTFASYHSKHICSVFNCHSEFLYNYTETHLN